MVFCAVWHEFSAQLHQCRQIKPLRSTISFMKKWHSVELGANPHSQSQLNIFVPLYAITARCTWTARDENFVLYTVKLCLSYYPPLQHKIQDTRYSKVVFIILSPSSAQDTRILFRYHRLTIEYNEIFIYTMNVKNKDQTNSK